jgi:3-phosphoshikimate 1-carboxyvinyltransferase
MEQRVKQSQSLSGEVVPPGDKSISHRALILSSIASGRARLSNPSPAADILSTIHCLRALGVEIREEGDGLIVLGGEGLSEPQDVLNAGNSATTMRLLAGLLCAQPFLSVITGDDSLRSRPMERLIQPLRLMGAEVWGRDHDCRAPLAIKGGKLHGIQYQLPVASAQVKSALLLAGLFAQSETTIEEPVPTRDHTELLLKAMGGKIEVEQGRITIFPGTEPLSPLDLHIPGDLSSAAFWLVAAAIHTHAELQIRNVGVNPTRSGIIDVLKGMGADLRIESERLEGGEPVADISIRSSSLVGAHISRGLITRLIDEIPVLAVAASVAKGTTTIRDAQELRVKETDRIVTTVKELSKLGAEIEELPDGMVIYGGKQLQGAECCSHNDHRLAMALGVAALVAEGETAIQDAEAVDFSYPGFWQELKRLSR